MRDPIAIARARSALVTGGAITVIVVAFAGGAVLVRRYQRAGLG